MQQPVLPAVEPAPAPRSYRWRAWGAVAALIGFLAAYFGLAGWFGLFTWIAICRNWAGLADMLALPGPREPLSGPYAALAALLFSGVPMTLEGAANVTTRVERLRAIRLDEQAAPLGDEHTHGDEPAVPARTATQASTMRP